MKKAVVVLLALLAVLALVGLAAAASTGSSAAAAPVGQTDATATPAAQATAAPTAKPAAAPAAKPAAKPAVAQAGTTLETCSICHKDAGSNHQAFYNELYQDQVIQVSDIKYSFSANPDTTTVSFKLLQNGQPIDPKQVDNISINWVPFKDGKFQFEPVMERLSMKGKVTSDGKGTVTSTLVEPAKTDPAYYDYTDVSKTDGLLVVYGRDGTVGTIPNSRVAQNAYPFAGLLQTGAGVKYESSANVEGCVKCHTDPYLKHGYIYGTVDGDTKTDFYTCKACHVDNGEGGHFEWQLLVDNPEKAAEYLAADEAEAASLLTAEEKKLYAYNTTVMNDVHMSHAMEFPYPQSMANCVTCHEGKLDKILADENFQAATCKSCHPVTGAKAEAKEGETPAWDTTGLALKTIMGEKHPPIDWAAPADCTTCHKTGGVAPAFNKIHTGYNTTIFASEGVKYSDAISVTIDSATLNGNKLAMKFSANAKSDFKAIDVTKDMTPTVIASLYGWDTRDFVLGGHERSIDDNKDGKVDTSRTSKDLANLEAVVGTDHPRVKTVSSGGGKWEVEFDLTPWANLLKDGTVKRVEVGVLPTTVSAATKQAVAVDATTRTFDLKTAKFDDKTFKVAADVNKCENCHEALGTTFHTPSYGGSVVACRMCHITKSGGSHLEMQSRAIDSYVHGIHSMQYFDVGTIDFNDPYQALKYEEHTTMPYPTHGIGNCESCHFEGKFEVPDQAEALPAIISASAQNDTWDRKIGTVPSVVTGPAEAACGGCHRAQLINEDRAGGLAVLNQHFTQHGYQVPSGQNPVDTWTNITNQVMSLFK
jgi:hypothetical protein